MMIMLVRFIIAAAGLGVCHAFVVMPQQRCSTTTTNNNRHHSPPAAAAAVLLSSRVSSSSSSFSLSNDWVTLRAAAAGSAEAAEGKDDSSETTKESIVAETQQESLVVDEEKEDHVKDQDVASKDFVPQVPDNENEESRQGDSYKEEEEQDEDDDYAEEDEAHDEQQEKEDLVKQLKEEIANLESTLRGKKSQLQYQEELVEMYSKGGYARKVAEMETMRRTRSNMNSSSKETAMASILQNFLPILDELESLKDKYGNDEFGSNYNALPGSLKSAMTVLGVQEYEVSPGDRVDSQRVTVLDYEYSNIISKDRVIRCVSNGYELQGNVMKMATCVASKGSEEEEEERERDDGTVESSNEGDDYKEEEENESRDQDEE